MSNRPQRNKKEHSTSVKGRLNNMELAGIALFLFCFVMYSMSKCFAEQPQQDNESHQIAEDTASMQLSSTIQREQLPPRKIDTSSFVRKLYVITDSLRLREAPNIGAALITYLQLGEAVSDLGERTLHEKIRISADELKIAPWVKVSTAAGIEGWAFGAFLQFYPLPEQATNHINSHQSSHQH